MSVGAVCRPEYLKQRKNAPRSSCCRPSRWDIPEMRHRMRNAMLVDDEARATGNYSYESTRMRGDRHIMVGDAYAFVDPIFSSGVLLGMNSGVFGAEAVDAWLRDDPARGEPSSAHFERMVRRGVKTFSWFIWRFNSPGHAQPDAASRQSVPRAGGGDVAARRRRLPRHRRAVALLAVQVLLLHVQPEARCATSFACGGCACAIRGSRSRHPHNLEVASA